MTDGLMHATTLQIGIGIIGLEKFSSNTGAISSGYQHLRRMVNVQVQAAQHQNLGEPAWIWPLTACA